MAEQSLENFLETTSLCKTINYVSNLLKTSNSKNITLEEWNLLIKQLELCVSQLSETYKGFGSVLEEITLLYTVINEVTLPIIDDIDDIYNILEDLWLDLQSLQQETVIDESSLRTMLQEVYP